MRLTYKQTERPPENSFLVRQDTMPCIEQDWHFHPEFELIYFLKSTGTRYVGNSIGSFGPGELYLIGSNMPHLFRNEKEYYDDHQEQKVVDLIVIKFERDFLGESFFSLSEAKKVDAMLHRAGKGLQFSQGDTYLVHNHIVGLVGSKGLSKITAILKILDILSVSNNYTELCAENVTNTFKKSERSRMAEIINYLNENFEKKIELQEIASVAKMTPNSFCRFFKKRTQKSFSRYLNEIRIRHACKLLIEGKLQISDICYQSGFNTITNFNRQFKQLMKVTPSQFMQKYEVSEHQAAISSADQEVIIA